MQKGFVSNQRTHFFVASYVHKIIPSFSVFFLQEDYLRINKHIDFIEHSSLSFCSPDFIEVAHPDWHDCFMFLKDKKTIRRINANQTAKILLFENRKKIIVQWEKEGKETFIYNPLIDVYHYQIDKEDLIDSFYKDVPWAKREGEVLDVTKHTILFKDKNGIKRFLKKDNVYELVQESKVSYTEPKKIAVLYISTGRYIVFWENFYKAMEKHFLPKHEKTYFLFTDHDDLKVADNVVKIHQDQLPWPYVTLKRYHFFDAIKDQLKEFDYIYFLNGDAKPVLDINEEIFPTNEQEVMVTLHSWFWLKKVNSYDYERNQKSKSYIPYEQGKFYVTGAFNGGTSAGFLKMTAILKDWTDRDIENNVIPIWHDESMLNKYVFSYFKDKKPLILFPEYVITEPYQYLARREFPFYKMVLVDKNKEGGRDFLRGIKK